MRIAVTGTRGIPGIQGGVETHCEHLFPRMVAMGHDVTVFRRAPYTATEEPRLTEYRGVKLVDVPTPRRKSLEAPLHTLRCVLRARRMGVDILHIHSIGPTLLVPLARLLGLKVVMTHHGPDYDRAKWGRLARTVLKLGERLGCRHANAVIVISRVIADIVARKHGRTDTDLIFNGVEPQAEPESYPLLVRHGLEPGRYILGLGRFVEEKGFHDLIEAYKAIGGKQSGWTLAIAGDADHPDEYSRRLKRMAEDAGVVLTGFISGEELRQVTAGAALFAMPSYHEGLPIALLEAMSHRLDVAVSDIPACRLPELEPGDYFAAGDTEALAALLRRKLSEPRGRRSYDLSAYDWDRIAVQTEAVYRRVMS